MSDARLRGWKEIADHLGVSVRSAQRSTASGLPVHRVTGEKRAGVFAFVAELDEWRRAAQAEGREDRPSTPPEPEAELAPVGNVTGEEPNSRSLVPQPIARPVQPRSRSIVRWSVFAVALLTTAAETRLPAPIARNSSPTPTFDTRSDAAAKPRIATHRRVILALTDREGTRFTTAIPDGGMAPISLAGDGEFGLTVRLRDGLVQLDIIGLDTSYLPALRANSRGRQFTLKKGESTSLHASGAAVDVVWIGEDEAGAAETRPGDRSDRCCLLSDGFVLNVCGERVTSPFGTCDARAVIRAR